MAENTAALKRGWHYDKINARLECFVDGHEAFHVKAKATGAMGTYDAGFKIVYSNSAAVTSGRTCALSINLEPTDAIDAYKVVGAEVCSYLASSVETTGSVHGLFVETQGGGTIGSDWYSLYVYSAPSCTASGSIAAVRIEQNATTDARSGAFIAFVGGKSTHLFELGPLAAQTCWNTTATGDANTIAGWFLLKMGGVDRYVYTYAIDPTA